MELLRIFAMFLVMFFNICPFMTDNLPHVIFDLLGVRSSYYKPSCSVINEKYHPQKHRKLQVGRVYD